LFIAKAASVDANLRAFLGVSFSLHDLGFYALFSASSRSLLSGLCGEKLLNPVVKSF
jgi:hypothetical protein